MAMSVDRVPETREDDEQEGDQEECPDCVADRMHSELCDVILTAAGMIARAIRGFPPEGREARQSQAYVSDKA